MSQKWTNEPGLIQLTHTLQDLTVRLARIRLAQQLKRAKAILDALIPKAPTNG